jgi:glyoxylase-like metal-dependent hydrolase (beta-lactamase superfamily II)
MFIRSFSAGVWQTNCYVVATQANSECIIIDPGYESLAQVAQIVSDFRLKPTATLLTHGHLDHMWSVRPLADSYEIPAFIHASDRHLLADPGAGISAETIAMLADSLGTPNKFVEPSDVRVIADGVHIELAGLNLDIRLAPGHTQGSILFGIAGDEPVMFTGDVLFAGAIGRTDLPGGSALAMDSTLRDVILAIDDPTKILPGHGPATTMANERVNNPYLRRIAQGLSAV